MGVRAQSQIVSSSGSQVITSNLNATNLNTIRAAIAKVATGIGDGKIMTIGDSTTAGHNAIAGNVNSYPKSWTNVLASYLNSSICTTSNKSWVGNQAESATNFDARIALTGGALFIGLIAFQSNTQVLGNGGVQLPSIGSKFSFTPVGNFDTIRIYAPVSVSGTFTVDIGGVSLGTVNTNTGGLHLPVSTFNVTPGTYTVNCTGVTGAPIVIGIECFDSTIPSLHILQAGWAGATAVQYAAGTQPASPAVSIAMWAPHLTFIDLTINDATAPTAIPTYTAAIQTLINGAKVTGDVILVTGNPTGVPTSSQSLIAQAPYISACYSLAVANNIGLIDIAKRWTSYTVTNPLMPYTDTTHPSAVGYHDIGYAVFSALQQSL